jgi:hypothetical protein
MTEISIEARRPIPWESFDVAALSTGARAVIGCTWRERIRQEHLAVGRAGGILVSPSSFRVGPVRGGPEE